MDETPDLDVETLDISQLPQPDSPQPDAVPYASVLEEPESTNLADPTSAPAPTESAEPLQEQGEEGAHEHKEAQEETDPAETCLEKPLEGTDPAETCLEKPEPLHQTRPETPPAEHTLADNEQPAIPLEIQATNQTSDSDSHSVIYLEPPLPPVLPEPTQTLEFTQPAPTSEDDGALSTQNQVPQEFSVITSDNPLEFPHSTEPIPPAEIPIASFPPPSDFVPAPSLEFEHSRTPETNFFVPPFVEQPHVPPPVKEQPHAPPPDDSDTVTPTRSPAKPGKTTRSKSTAKQQQPKAQPQDTTPKPDLIPPTNPTQTPAEPKKKKKKKAKEKAAAAAARPPTVSPSAPDSNQQRPSGPSMEFKASPEAEAHPPPPVTADRTQRFNQRVNQLLEEHRAELQREIELLQLQEMDRQTKFQNHFVAACVRAVEKVVSDSLQKLPHLRNTEKLESIIAQATGPKFKEWIGEALKNQEKYTHRDLIELFRQVFRDVVIPKFNSLCTETATQSGANFDQGIRHTLSSFSTQLQNPNNHPHPLSQEEMNLASSLHHSVANLSQIALQMSQNIQKIQASYIQNLKQSEQKDGFEF